MMIVTKGAFQVAPLPQRFARMKRQQCGVGE